MARYIVERTFPDGFDFPLTSEGRDLSSRVVDTNAAEGVTWIHSYFDLERTKSFCVYDGPSPESVRRVAARNGLPVDQVTQVRVLDPYFFGAD